MRTNDNQDSYSERVQKNPVTYGIYILVTFQQKPLSHCNFEKKETKKIRYHITQKKNAQVLKKFPPSYTKRINLPQNLAKPAFLANFSSMKAFLTKNKLMQKNPKLRKNRYLSTRKLLNFSSRPPTTIRGLR